MQQQNNKSCTKLLDIQQNDIQQKIINEMQRRFERYYNVIPRHKWKLLCIKSLWLYQYLLKVMHEYPERNLCNNELRFSYDELCSIFPPDGLNHETVIRLLDKLEKQELIHRIRHSNVGRKDLTGTVLISIFRQNQHSDLVPLVGANII